ncbi:YfiR family protein [Nitrogeniibacter mangrovi]|uniref:YfiR family protein n=1 Tax=Nitrogeniibacter mangrovi TaxID=2016596 RepID=A0A6C1B5H4_9RHOO|nr:YfiR family protein [Nitrogeniibacter mangrovi]QID18962.1 YfiR family protein [Nitrogeniibacter mangrovi]
MFARLLASFLLLLSCVVPALAAPTEYQLKAVFLLNFARYATWPEAALPPGAPIDICVLGRDPFGTHLAGLESRLAQGRAVRIRYPESAERARDCQVLFLAASEQRRLNATLRDLDGAPVLTVSDIDGFVEAGGAIGFVTEDDRVRFDINRGTLEHDGLKLSAQLLKLARRLVGEDGP